MSKEFYDIFAGLMVKNVLGKSMCFRKLDDYYVCCRWDEETSNVFFYLMFDEYSFRFPGDEMTVNNFQVVLESCKRQGFLKDPSFKMNRVVDKKGDDVLQIYNKKSSMSCRLYSTKAYPDELGFTEEVDFTDLDPVMFSFDLTAKEIQEIVDICNGKLFECTYFNFSLKADCIVMCFTGPHDIDYKIRIEKDRVKDFDKIEIGEEFKFNFNCFTIMDQLGLDYNVAVRSLDDNYNVHCNAELTVGNQVIKSLIISPSKVSNE